MSNIIQPIEQLSSRVKYYLLDWKDKNLHYVIKFYGKSSLRDFSKLELLQLWKEAINSDSKILKDNITNE